MQTRFIPLEEIEQIPDTDMKGVSPERFDALTHSPEAHYLRDMLVTQPNPMKLDDMTQRLNSLTKQHYSQQGVALD
jgi:hypothetical protein